MTRIWIIVLLIIYAMVLFNHYEPSIDIIVQGKRYRVLLWYNSYKSNYPNKPIVVRNYIQLFVI
nr:MAG TPA: hypothetical protein [Crassvirales sp.]